MHASREMLAYFNHSSFQRLFAAAARKYRALGRVGGTVRLCGLTPEEQEALTGFLGRDCRDRAEITVSLQEMDGILQQSRFSLAFPEFLSRYFGDEMRSHKEMARQEEQQWAVFFAGLAKQACTPAACTWLSKLAGGRGAGYRVVLALYRQDKPGAAELLEACVRALDRLILLPGRRQRLPVFAANLTGDPHALDGDKPLGRLLFFSLHHLYGLSETEYGAERRKALFSRAGLEEDDLSSNVIVAGLKVQPQDPRAAVFTASAAAASPLLLPLRFLAQPTAWLPRKIYVLENPAVCSALLDAAPAGVEIPALLCTSGQPSVAALVLLDQLIAAGAAICYSGDFDPAGLEIGQRLAERYAAAFQPWFFDADTYLQAKKGVKLTGEQRKKLAGLQIAWDNRLVETMLQVGKAVYQEVFVEQMGKHLYKQPGSAR